MSKIGYVLCAFLSCIGAFMFMLPTIELIRSIGTGAQFLIGICLLICCGVCAEKADRLVKEEEEDA